MGGPSATDAGVGNSVEIRPGHDAAVHARCRASTSTRICSLHGRRIVVGGLALALIAGGCGLGERAALEDAITKAPELAEDGLVAGTIAVEARFIEGPEPGSGDFTLPVGAEDFQIPQGGVALASDSASFEMDLATSRAALTRPGSDSPFVYMDDLVLYGRRGGVPDTDARPWLRLDLGDLGTGGGELDPFGDTAQAIAALHPAIITDLASGSLTGSIEERGRDRVGGVEASRYEVNVSIAKALGDKRRERYPEERREAVDELIELLGVDGDLHAAEVWLDDDGHLRRFSVSLTQRPATRIEFALVMTVDYETYGGTYVDGLPTPQEVLTVDTVIRFIRAVAATGDDSGEAAP